MQQRRRRRVLRPARPPRRDERERRGALRLATYVLFFTSGAVGLVYQVIWLRQLTLIFGATAYASSAVLSTFMGGLALGSAWAGRNADRWQAPPLRAYGALELGITAYAALIPWLLDGMTPVLELAWRLGADRHFVALGLVKFAAIAILILPATTLMGATLPVLSRVAARTATTAGSGVGALYAVNTFGAVVGTIAAAFAALPALGMRRTLVANIALNALVGAIAWILGREGDAPERDSAETPAAPQARKVPRFLLLAFAASGFAAMVLEVTWTRGLALVLGSSVYAYASMLTAFLVGLASGAASASWALRRRRIGSGVALGVVIGAAGLLSFLAAYAIQALPRLFAEIFFRWSPSPEGWWLAQLGMALLVMFPTTYALGWVFPLGLDVAGRAQPRVAAAVGRIYAANTIGTIVGAACAGFVLVPWLGVGATLLWVAIGQMLLGAALLARPLQSDAKARRVLAGACVVAALLGVAFRPRWDILLMNSGVYMNVQEIDRDAGWAGFLKQFRSNNRLVYARDGLTASILVGDQPAFDNRYLAVNGKIDASSREDLETQVVLGHLPLLFHRAPRDVLVVGLASGITVGSVATHGVDRIRVVEVESAMVEAARRFSQHNHGVLDDPRLTLSINDARNELQLNPATYDVIISEPSNPWMTVAANLFTKEFFEIGRSRLRPGGVFGQWVQTYCLTPRSVKSIIAGFRSSFAHVLVFEALNGVDLMLIGSDRPLVLDVPELEQRMSDLWVRADLARVGVRDGLDVSGMLQTGGGALDDLLAGAVVNTDDNGLIEFSAPKSLYLDTQEANLAMLQGNSDDPMTAVRPLIRTPENADKLRLELVRRWVRRDQSHRAASAAGLFENTALKSEADALLDQAR